jgi:hypothetical protein
MVCVRSMSNMGDLETLRAAIEAAREHLDCGDSSCRFALRKGGMRTNGHCRCFDRPHTARSLEAVWKAAVAVAESMTWKPLDTLERTGAASERQVLVVAQQGGFQGGADYRVSAGCYVRLDTEQDHARRPTLWMPIPEVGPVDASGK